MAAGPSNRKTHLWVEFILPVCLAVKEADFSLVFWEQVNKEWRRAPGNATLTETGLGKGFVIIIKDPFVMVQINYQV